MRFTDLDTTISGARDFATRRHIPTIVQVGIFILVAVLVVIILTVAFNSKTELIGMMSLLLGVTGWYVIIQLQRNRDLVLATEFQNALFASALGINNKFCLIIKRDGNIIYLDRSFQELFPDFLKLPRRTIDILLEYGKVSQADGETIFNAIAKGVYDKVIFDIRGSDGSVNKIVMSVEPILRPSGFILLRGREFIEKRNAETGVSTPPMLNKSNITLFSYVMDTMNIGVYVTGPAGNIIYTNPTLELWLGFREGEIVSGNLSVTDIIHPGANHTETAGVDNYEGDISLKQKTGGIIKAFINQKVIHDDQGKIMGCTALVHNVVAGDADTKKKLW